MGEKDKKTLVLGAVNDSTRYAYTAVKMLQRFNFEVVAVGRKTGNVLGVDIQTGQPPIEGIHTVTLYVGTRNLPPFFDYLISLKPNRIIFNPGTENYDLKALAEKNGIETVFGCTLVMLSMGIY